MSLDVDIRKKLDGMTLSVSFHTQGPGELTGILGASGCGKSVTLQCIAGILSPDQGRIVLNGRVLFDSEKGINLKIQKRRVGYLFQSYALFPHMTIAENVGVSLPVRRRGRREEIGRMLRLLEIDDIGDCYPAYLSGGQRQRAALARILISGPEVLILDEPFSALDYYLKEKLQAQLLKVLMEYRGDVLMVTHSRDEVYRFCRRIHVLDQGRLITSGETGEIFSNPGTVAAARLTGCKNIAAFCRLSEDELLVPEWGLKLKCRRKIPADAGYLGIRAHDLRGRRETDRENLMPCLPAQVLEEPFERTFILENGVWWKVTRRQWIEQYASVLPEELTVEEDSLLFLRGD